MKNNPLVSIENVTRLPFFRTTDAPSEVALIKTHNHVFRIQTGDRMAMGDRDYWELADMQALPSRW